MARKVLVLGEVRDGVSFVMFRSKQSLQQNCF